MRRSSSIGAILVLALSATLVGAAVAPSAEARSLRREAVLKELNQRRHEHGLRRLDMPRWLVHYARHHSRDMAHRGYIFHTSDLASVLRSVRWREAGENVGAGGDWRSVFRAFMRSPEHRWNMLHAAYRHVGIGLVNRRGWVYITLFFYG